MTIEELLACSADQLEKMSDAELLKHFEQYLNVTRPERARLQPKQTKPQPQFVSPGKRNALQALANMGVDMDLFRKKRIR